MVFGDWSRDAGDEGRCRGCTRSTHFLQKISRLSDWYKWFIYASVDSVGPWSYIRFSLHMIRPSFIYIPTVTSESSARCVTSNILDFLETSQQRRVNDDQLARSPDPQILCCALRNKEELQELADMGRSPLFCTLRVVVWRWRFHPFPGYCSRRVIKNDRWCETDGRCWFTSEHAKYPCTVLNFDDPSASSKLNNVGKWYRRARILRKANRIINS